MQTHERETTLELSTIWIWQFSVCFDKRHLTFAYVTDIRIHNTIAHWRAYARVTTILVSRRPVSREFRTKFCVSSAFDLFSLQWIRWLCAYHRFETVRIWNGIQKFVHLYWHCRRRKHSITLRAMAMLVQTPYSVNSSETIQRRIPSNSNWWPWKR